MIRYYFRKLGKSERGAAMVEFALAVTILLTLLFGIIEFAWILHGHITLTGAVREGARIAVVSDYSGKSESEIEDSIKQAVVNHARTFQLTPGDVSVIFGNYGEETIVEVKEADLPLLVGIFGNTFKIAGFGRDVSATMMQE